LEVAHSLSNQPTCKPANLPVRTKSEKTDNPTWTSNSSKDACTSVTLVSCLKPYHCWGHITVKEIQTNIIKQGCVLFIIACFFSETSSLLGTGHPKRDPVQTEEPVIDIGRARLS
jgi:hypothetical protein